MRKYKQIYQIYDKSIIWLDNETAIKLDVKIPKEFLNSYKSQWWVRMPLCLVLIFPLIFINLYFLKENTSFRSNYNIAMCNYQVFFLNNERNDKFLKEMKKIQSKKRKFNHSKLTF